MKSHTKTALGIDIGARHISAALVERTSCGFKVVASANEDFPAGESPQRIARARMSREFRKLSRRVAARGTHAVVAVSSDFTIMRLLDLPRQMPANIREFVDAELNQYVALSGKRRRTDFCGIATGSAAQKRLLVVAADADEMEGVLHMCGASRIVVNSVEPAALAYARTLLASEKSLRHSGETLIAILDASRLVMCLFCKGMLDFVRIRDVPPGMGTPEQIRVWLAEELSVVLQYRRVTGSEARSQVQTRVVIHDAGYDKTDIAPLCIAGAKTPIVVNSSDPIDLLCEAPERSSSMPSAVAVGAALKLLGVQGDELRIDLTPHEVIRARLSSKRLLIAANAAAVLFLAVFLAVQVLAKTTDTMNRRIGQARLDGQLHRMPAVVAQDRYLDEQITRVRRELAGMHGVLARRDVDWPAVLDVIARSAPPGVGIVALACDDGRCLSVKGGAESYDGAKSFAQNLDDQEVFESVRPVHMGRRQIDANGVEYEIACVLRTTKEESIRDDRSQP